jgi:hypothetical protein
MRFNQEINKTNLQVDLYEPSYQEYSSNSFEQYQVIELVPNYEHLIYHLIRIECNLH